MEREYRWHCTIQLAKNRWNQSRSNTIASATSQCSCSLVICRNRWPQRETSRDHSSSITWTRKKTNRSRLCASACTTKPISKVRSRSRKSKMLWRHSLRISRISPRTRTCASLTHLALQAKALKIWFATLAISLIRRKSSTTLSTISKPLSLRSPSSMKSITRRNDLAAETTHLHPKNIHSTFSKQTPTHTIL